MNKHTQKALFILILLGISSTSCSRGGSNSKPLQLKALSFDLSEGGASSNERVPRNAPLWQPIRLLFSVGVSKAQVQESFSIIDGLGEPIDGQIHFENQNRSVTFYPELSRAEGSFGALKPSAYYDIVIAPNLLEVANEVDSEFADVLTLEDGSVIGRITREDGAFAVRFKTAHDADDYYRDMPNKAPIIVQSIPSDNSKDVPPGLYSVPESRGFQLVFDSAMNPSAENIDKERIQVREVKDSSGKTQSLLLASSITLVSNTPVKSVIRVQPSGLLPMGSRVGLYAMGDFKSFLSERGDDPSMRKVALFDISDSVERVQDVFTSTFDTAEYYDESAPLSPGISRARWEGSGYVAPGYQPQERGHLGPFLPMPGEGGVTEIILDTDSQEFPLFDGSTPEARPGTVVVGGVFTFTRVDIPEGVVLRGQGSNPLVIIACDDVSIDGDVDVSGANGVDDESYDSAITPTPGGVGGPGGGRGGDANPTVFDGAQEFLRLVPPRFAQNGKSLGVPGAVGRL